MSSLTSTTSIPVLSKRWCLPILQHMASFGQRSSHYTHSQYGLLNLSVITHKFIFLKKMISVLHRRRRKHCCQHQSRKFRSTKTFHIVQNGLSILTSNHLARTLYQTYRKKTRRNTLLHTSCDSWPFDPRPRIPSRIISYRRISGKNVSDSQHFFTWHKISSPCFPNFIWRETWFSAILYTPSHFHPGLENSVVSIFGELKRFPWDGH